MSRWRQTASADSSRWLSREFSELLAGLSEGSAPKQAEGFDFDILVVGSGYGGAVAAAQFAGSRNQSGALLRVAVLERGREFLPGSFPSRLSEMPTEVRGSAAGRTRGGEGLFDARLGAEMSVLVANGLGGGSLINAGVMETPDDAVFDARWPAAWRDAAARAPYYREARRLLGAVVDDAAAGPQQNTIDRHARQAPDKTHNLLKMATAESGARYRPAAVTIAMRDQHTLAGVALSACKRCGDCATGCNYSAKQSLDTNLLASAMRQGAEIYCGATVLRLERVGAGIEGWRLLVTHTDEKLRLKEAGPRWVSAQRVVLAAGTLGTTEILLRSTQASLKSGAAALRFSSRLGQGFSGNGDMLHFGYDQSDLANAFADENLPPARREVGPTITAILDVTLPVEGGAAQKIVIEDLAVPGALKRFTEEMLTTADTLHALGEFDRSSHRQGHPEQDPFAVQPAKIARTTVYAAMGDDGAGGVLQLNEAAEAGPEAGDGQLVLSWPEAPSLPLFQAQSRLFAELSRVHGRRGRSLPNPLWKLLPDSMANLIGGAQGPLLTVHPLGGCGMGVDAQHGVVDEYGRVFDASADGAAAVHEGLIVLDGAIVPSALATNPALTIAALALRAVQWHSRQWQLQAPAALAPWQGARPVLRDVEAELIAREAEAPAPTEAQFSERLVGPVTLPDAQGHPAPYMAELTLTYQPLVLQTLFRPDALGRLSGAELLVEDDSEQPPGVLSLYPLAQWQQLADLWPNHPDRDWRRNGVVSYAVAGKLTVLQREQSSALQRTLRGLAAWWPNRGARDVFQAIEQGLRQGAGVAKDLSGFLGLIPDAIRLASHAGEVRLFDYDLKLIRELKARAGGASPHFRPGSGLAGEPLRGQKRIRYARPSNPWRQLTELHLQQFPGLAPGSALPMLKLEPAYFAARATPLWQITWQQEHLEALVDAVSLLAYFLRMVISIHLWNARKPEPPSQRRVQRLPGPLPGLPAPDVHWVPVESLAGQPVSIRLTRYRRAGLQRAEGQASAVPVVLIHGYSASGTTFAHPSLKPSLAKSLADAGHDVWVLDLRTSCGMPSALHPWTFEHVALSDVPLAIDYVCAKSGSEKVDVVAHCMGAAMFSMAVLSAGQDVEDILSGRELRRAGPTVLDRYRIPRQQLPGRIRRAVLSQVGPVVVLSPENIFRSYALSFFEQVLGAMPYRFRREDDSGGADELLDRLLATLPYPDDELLQENSALPWARAPYLGARHRMDALYGRTFSLRNLSKDTLTAIDDFFGPLNLDTVAQVMHFASLRTITNRQGQNRFVSHQKLQKFWQFPTLSLHGSENGLSDPATAARLERVLGPVCGPRFKSQQFPGLGHQDSLIGHSTAPVFAAIREFLAPQQADRAEEPLPEPAPKYTARPAALGPLLLPAALGPEGGRARSYYLGLGSAPELGEPVAVCFWPAHWDDEHKRLSIERDRRHIHAVDTRLQRDWLSVPLPAFADGEDVKQLLVLLLYSQDNAMSMPATEPLEAARARAHPALFWSTLASRRFDLELKGTVSLDPEISGVDHGDSQQALDAAEQQEHAAMQVAIDAALARCDETCLQDRQAPDGLVWVPGPERDGAAAGLRLVLGSCQYAPGILDGPVAYAAWQQLAETMELAGEQPHLLVLAGDQVYTDATAGLFDPAQADDRYRKPYERLYGSEPVRRVLCRVPVVSTIDDHEIADNWEPPHPSLPDTLKLASWHQRRDGVEAFQRYQRADLRRPRGRGADAIAPPPLWTELSRQGLPIFLLDARSERWHRAATEPAQRRMLRGEQAERLHDWLRRQPADLPKIIVAPSLLLPRHRRAVPARLAFGFEDRRDTAVLRSDSADGYPETLFPLLALIAEQQWRGVVLLSGDEHLGLITTVDLQTGGAAPARLHSIHSPGLYAPYRFANADPADFVLDEAFEFQAPDHRKTHCRVATQVFRQSGFVGVNLGPAPGGDWRLLCTDSRQQTLLDTLLFSSKA